jgi:hypothetical protein
MGETRIAYNILLGKPKEKGPLERSRDSGIIMLRGILEN